MSYTFVVSNCGNDCHIKTKFNPTLELDEAKEYEMALVNLETYWSFPNVTEKNNLFKFSDFKKNRHILIPKGAYELDEINNYIQDQMVKLGFEKNTIKIAPNKNTLKCMLYISKGYMVDMNPANSLASILGFNHLPYIAKYEDKTYEGESIVKIININSIYIHNNIISHSYIDGSLSPVLYSFFPKTGVGEKIIEQPRERVYSPINLNTITSMETWLTDQDNNDLDLQGENLTIRFHLREVANSYMDKMLKLMQKI